MRRFAFVLVVAVSALFLLGSSASALCVVVPFDKLVHGEPVIWWGKVVGVQKVDGPSGSWALSVRIDQVLKGTESVGDVGPAQLGSCGVMVLWKRSAAEQYVGQTRLFMGSIRGGVLLTAGEIYPQGLSPQEQYERALKDLGLERAQSTSPHQRVNVRPMATSRFPVWAIVVLAALVVLLALGIFVVARRRRAATR